MNLPRNLMGTLFCLAMVAVLHGGAATPAGGQLDRSSGTSHETEAKGPYACEEDLIEVMFLPESKVRLRKGRLVDLATNAMEGTSELLAQLPWFEWHRICDVPETKLDEIQLRGEANTGNPVYNLNNIYRLRIPGGYDVWRISQALEALPGVIIARPVPKPTPPPLPPNYEPHQRYLDPASSTPTGIDAEYAWSLPGGDGTGVTVCDLEYNWNYNHADVTKEDGSQINPDWTDNGWSSDHGTAVIGEVVSDNNGWGTTGVCYGASLKTCGTIYATPTPHWNVPGAIALAVANLSAGDVIILEQQWDYTGSDDYVPVEWWLNYSPNPQTFNGVYAAIVNAVSNGIHVVEAGGNGAVDTDTLVWYGDSGAIIVGAGGVPGGGYPEGDLQKLSYSTFGSRFNLQGWGEAVYTTGYGYLYSAEGEDYYYTDSFAGTSSASPIVAGAVACCVGYWVAQGETAASLTPADLRDILENTGTPQVTPPVGHIGPRPDLLAAFASLKADSIPPVVTVTAPNGGETWNIGGLHDITWTATDENGISSVSLYYSTNGGGNYTLIAAGQPNDGVHPWTVTGPPSDHAIVKVVAYDSFLNAGQDTSDAVFTIADSTAPSVTVLSPNGGETWTGTTMEDITWTATDDHGVDSVSIYYSINNGGSYDLVASGEANDGIYPWTVPVTPTDSALVRVVAYDPSLNSGADTSDSTFTIVTETTPPVVTVATPNGGETWYVGDPHDVLWEAYDPSFGTPVTDDFTDGDDIGWSHHCYTPTCNWAVTSGVYYLTGSPGPTLSTLDATNSWSDYVFDVDVRTDTGANRIVILRYVDPNTYYKLVMRAARLILSRHTVLSDTNLVVVTGLSYSTGTWYGIRALAQGANIQVYVDGDKLIDVVDPDPILTGPVGVRAETNEECLFDNVTVTQLDGVDSVDILYSTDGGSTFPHTMATGETNDWHYEWTVTGPPSNQAVVKVVATDQSMNSGEDTSDANFTIAVFDTTDPAVTVLTPNGGETWYIGNSEDITWTAADANGVDSVSILYSVNDGDTYDVISSGETNDGTYPWTIPSTPTDSALVKVVAYDPSLNMGKDVSDARFTISEPPDTTDPAVTVLTPNGGEIWYGVDTEDITWTATDANGVDSVSIFYSLDGGGIYHPIASGETNDGAYTWLLPDTFTVDALVRVIAYDPSLNTGQDESDAVFTIADNTGPIVDVSAPDGGEFVEVWSSYDITWTATDPSGVDSVTILYSANGGDTYDLIASEEANDGTFSWSVPNVLTDSALVKIIAYDTIVNSGEGVSDSLFVIWSGTIDAPGRRRHLGDTVLLWQNSPNPFTPGTNISFYLPEEATVHLAVFDAKGRLVNVLINGDIRGAGVHTVPWNGRDRDGGRLGSGVYFYRLGAGNVTLVKKMVMTQ